MLELQNITYRTENELSKEIIKNVSLKFESGQFVAITGPNGSGKSTLVRLIAGINKPNAGKIIFNDNDITDTSITGRAKLGISYAFQQPVKFKGITVRELIELAAEKTIPFSLACDYLSEVGLCAKNYIDRDIDSSLSGGELKRIEIATILARSTLVSIFDEPEAGIDLWSFKNLINVFEHIRGKKQNGIVLVITHQEKILNIADRIIVLSEGNVLKDGNKEKILPELLKSDTVYETCNKFKAEGVS